MMSKHEKLNDHVNFKELAAWATSNMLTPSEWVQLRDHSQICDECREVYRQYMILAAEGIPLLATPYNDQEAPEAWDDGLARRKLFDRIRLNQQEFSADQAEQLRATICPNFLPRIVPSMLRLTRVALAICLVCAVALFAYRLGIRIHVGLDQLQASVEDRSQAARKGEAVNKLEGLPDAQKKTDLRSEEEGFRKTQELIKLRSDLRRMEQREIELVSSNTALNEQSQDVLRKVDALKGQLRGAEEAYANVQAEAASLRSEREESLDRNASLESTTVELSATARRLERRLAEDEQYLASDRDIRELMGARKLYIADVFDVDSHSRTRKPFGRIFYTQDKSLIFYAFDLEADVNLKNAGAFQVWGRKVTVDEKPLSLGIFYMDNESNRRWVLRFDNSEQMAKIDAVFVTVEPHGGSEKPTGKPFLYALLRREVNHP